MLDKNMVGFLNRTMFGMVLLVPIFYLDGLGTIARGDYFSFQGWLAINTPSASNLSVFLGAVIWASSSSEAPSSSA